MIGAGYGPPVGSARRRRTAIETRRMSKATGPSHLAAWNIRVPKLVPALGAFAPATRGSALPGLKSRRKRSWLSTGCTPRCGDVLAPEWTTDLTCRRAVKAGCAPDGSARAVSGARDRWAEPIRRPLTDVARGRVTSPGLARTIVATGRVGALVAGAGGGRERRWRAGRGRRRSGTSTRDGSGRRRNRRGEEQQRGQVSVRVLGVAEAEMDVRGVVLDVSRWADRPHD